MNVSILRTSVGFTLKGMITFGSKKLSGFDVLGVKGIEKGLNRVITLFTIVQDIRLLKS